MTNQLKVQLPADDILVNKDIDLQPFVKGIC